MPVDMPLSRPSLCITCGLSVGLATHLNRMEDGSACPTCRDRLLDVLPPPFPGFGHLLERKTSPDDLARPNSQSRGSLSSLPKKQRRGPKGGTK